MDRASPRRRAAGTRRSQRTDISSPADRTARHALRPTASIYRGVPPAQPFSESRRDARPCRFPARTVRLSLACSRTNRRRRHRRSLRELEHEAIGLTAMLEHEPGAIVFGMTQRARRAGQFEAGLLDILDQKLFVD